MWEQELIEVLKQKVDTYPLVALLDELLLLNCKQKERIEQLKTQVDGQPWSPSEWKK